MFILSIRAALFPILSHYSPVRSSREEIKQQYDISLPEATDNNAASYLPVWLELEHVMRMQSVEFRKSFYLKKWSNYVYFITSCLKTCVFKSLYSLFWLHKIYFAVLKQQMTTRCLHINQCLMKIQISMIPSTISLQWTLPPMYLVYLYQSNHMANLVSIHFVKFVSRF